MYQLVVYVHTSEHTFMLFRYLYYSILLLFCIVILNNMYKHRFILNIVLCIKIMKV